MVPEPQGERDLGWILFFIVFMMLGCFIFLNLFVAVVISTFHNEEERVGGSELLTDKQKEYIDLRLLVLRSQPIKKAKPPTNKCRLLFFKVYTHRYFERAIQGIIILNTMVLMLRWYRQP
jgi:hypothetical protein